MAPRVGLSDFIVWDAPASPCDGIDLERPHYTFGFSNPCPTGDGPDRRATLFGAYAAGLADTFSGLFDMPAREAWVEANEILEGPGIEWAYQRASSPTRNTYGARIRETEPTELGSDSTFFTARGSC